jgi:hypothetical protein
MFALSRERMFSFSAEQEFADSPPKLQVVNVLSFFVRCNGVFTSQLVIAYVPVTLSQRESD